MVFALQKNYSDLSKKWLLKLFLPLARKKFSLVLKMPWLNALDQTLSVRRPYIFGPMYKRDF